MGLVSQLDRPARRGLDEVVTVPFPPPVLREGHPEPAIDGRGGLERAAGWVRTEGSRKAEEAAATVSERECQKGGERG